MSPAAHPAVIGATVDRQVVFVGPMGVGKTTAVTSLSDVPVVGTDVGQSRLALTGTVPADGKTTTTVGIDYGEWVSPDVGRVGLYGTPGQVRFASARTSVTGWRSRLVLWAFGDHADTAGEIARWLDLVGDASTWERTVVAVTRLERTGPEAALGRIRAALDPRFHHVPLLAADPRVRDDVARATLTALSLTPGSAA